MPRKTVVRLTDRPDMTLDVYSGRKTTIQQYACIKLIVRKNEYIIYNIKCIYLRL